MRDAVILKDEIKNLARVPTVQTEVLIDIRDLLSRLVENLSVNTPVDGSPFRADLSIQTGAVESENPPPANPSIVRKSRK